MGARLEYGGSEGVAYDSARIRDVALGRSHFHDRIDEPLVFSPLDREEVAEVAHRMLASLAERLRDRGIRIGWERSAIEALLDAGGFDPELGARPMRRIVGRLVEAPLAGVLLEGRHGGTPALRLVGEGTEIRIVPDSDHVSGCEAAE